MQSCFFNAKSCKLIAWILLSSVEGPGVCEDVHMVRPIVALNLFRNRRRGILVFSHYTVNFTDLND